MKLLGAPVEHAALERAHRVALAAGDILVSEGERGDDVFLIESGCFDVHQAAHAQPIARLEAGDIVGEMAVVAGGPRSASVVAVTDATVLRMGRDLFAEMRDATPALADRIAARTLERLNENQLRAAIERLMGTSVDELFPLLARSVEWSEIPSGHVLFEPGDRADRLMLVVRGVVRVEEPTSAGAAVSTDVGAGQVVDGAALRSSPVHSRRAVAVRDCAIASVDRGLFFEFVRTDPARMVPMIVDRLAEAASSRGARPNHRVISVVTSPDLEHVVAKLAAAMAGLDDTAWVDEHSAAHLFGRQVDQAQVGSPADIRMSQLLHELELTHSFVLASSASSDAWAARIVRQADVVVAVCRHDVEGRDLVRIRDFIEQSPAGVERLLVVVQPAGIGRPSGMGPLAASVGASAVINLASLDDIARVARRVTQRSVGFVLGGGGARGFAHVGVRRALAELSIPVDRLAGTSIGAALGGLIARGDPVDGFEDHVARMFRRVLDYTLPVETVVKGRRISRRIDEAFGGLDFEDLWTPFFCVSTNVTTASEVVHDAGTLAPAVRASLAIPGVIPAVVSGQDLLIDGGVLNNLPCDRMRTQADVGTVIAADVAPLGGPRAPKASTSMRRARRIGPAGMILRAMLTGSTRERARSIQRGDADLHLGLHLKGVGLLEFGTVHPVAQNGYDLAMPMLMTWLEGYGEPWRVAPATPHRVG